MGRIIFGFLAGAVAVLLVHQPIILILKAAGMLPATAVVYNMAASAAAPAAIAAAFAKLGFAGLPSLFNLMFWGGAWGALYGLFYNQIPGGFAIIKGLILGLTATIVGNWLVIPLLAGQPLFAGFAPPRLLNGILINGGWGIGTGIIYSLMRRS